MLESTLCSTQPSSTSYWATFTWQVFAWLSQPFLIISVLLIMIGLPWLVQRWRWKRPVSGLGVALLVSYLALLSPPVIAVGTRLLTSLLPSDPGSTADAIVVLGRGAGLRPERAEVAAELWHAKRAPLIFSSGRGDAIEIAALLQQRGVPEAAIAGEPCSRTTEENAQFTAILLRPRQVNRILLVTDPPHMLRSLLTFRSLGFEVMPHFSPLPSHLQTKIKAIIVFREYLGLLSYGLRGRFLPREPSSVEVAQVFP